MSHSPHPTQQQLDELEALMQRMLALPVNQLEDESGNAPALPSLPPAPEWEIAPEEPSFRPAILQRMEEDQAPPQPVEEENLPDPVAVTERTLPAGWPLEPEATPPAVEEKVAPLPAAKPEPIVPILRPAIVVRPPEMDSNGTPSSANEMKKVRPVPAARLRRPVRERPGWLTRSLLWSNRGFDRRIGRLGSAGRWLRGRYGRAFLGLTGLILLAAALVLGALDWIEWTW